MDYMNWLADLLKGTYGVEEGRIRSAAKVAGIKRQHLCAARSMLGVKTLTVWGSVQEPDKRFWFLPGEGPGDRHA